MSDKIRGVLAGLVAPESLLPREGMERWRIGEGDVGLPAAVLAPATEEELASVLFRCSQEGWRVLPAGLGTWLGGGGPCPASVVVSVMRLQGIKEYEPADLTFTASAGLPLKTLQETTRPHGQWLPLNPPGSHRGSLGALVALGRTGSLGHLYGTPRDHVLGLTMVSGSGDVLRWGGRVVKNVAGFDVTRLTVGSWGALGVVTTVSARLFPIPEADLTLIGGGEMVADLLPAARTLAMSPMPLAAVELADPLPVEGGWGERSFLGEPSAALAIRLLGSRAQVAEMEKRTVSEISSGVEFWGRLEGEESRAFHRSLGDWEEDSELVVRMSLFPSKLGLLLQEGERLRELGGDDRDGKVRAALSAHVGSGVLRVAVAGLPGSGDGLGAWITFLQGLRVKLEGLGGSLTLSSGPDLLMKEVGPWGSAGPEKDLAMGLKNRFDPKNILAPGRLGLE